MFSNKKSIQQLVALMLDYGVVDVVLSPGSRNAPLIHTFTQHGGFRCHTIVDERSAAYFALGMILQLKKPVAICCTSGTALLNYSSAAAEAFYQKLPLLVISADRPAHWVGQADGQTINQKNVLANFVKKSVTLPEVTSTEDAWLCNRLINESLIALTRKDAGPVHLNLPLSEPLYEFTEASISAVRRISLVEGKALLPNSYAEKWSSAPKRMVILGQHAPDVAVEQLAAALSQRNDVVVIAEHTANVPSAYSIAYFEQVLMSMDRSEEMHFCPDLLITIGGHVVSKRLKLLLRRNKPQMHWHIGPEVVDTYQCITSLLDIELSSFTDTLAMLTAGDSSFKHLWSERAAMLARRSSQLVGGIAYSDLKVYSSLFDKLPEGISLHLGNSSPVRYAQLFGLPENVEVYSNRGTSGIDGSLSTFMGFASLSERLSLLIIGELSFLYDSNGLWTRYTSPNARILVVNNSGGGIFRLIDGPSKSQALEQHIEYRHEQSVELIAKAFGLAYLSAKNEEELQTKLPKLLDKELGQATVLEVFTPYAENSAIYKSYIENLKTK